MSILFKSYITSSYPATITLTNFTYHNKWTSSSSRLDTITNTDGKQTHLIFPIVNQALNLDAKCQYHKNKQTNKKTYKFGNRTL